MDTQFNTPGFYFQWHFLETCNLKCRHCYQKGVSLCGSNSILIDKTIEQIAKALAAWKVAGRVSLTGGEPFLEIDTLASILNRLNSIERVTNLGVLTNGTLIDDAAIDMLRNIPKLGEVQVSLDGSTETLHDATRGVGAFAGALSGMRRLSNNGIPTAIMFTATQINKHDVQGIIDLAVRENVAAITIERYTPTGGAHDPLALSAEDVRGIFLNLLRCKRKLKQLGCSLKVRTSRPLWNLLDESVGGVCPVGYSCLTIMHDGTMYPCRRMPIPLGTIQDDGIFKVWYTSSILRRLRKRQDVNGCSGCKHEHLCGGCRAAAYAMSGNFMGKDPICWKGNKRYDG
jgi:radical SAM protein with 4Fe4S-binding SPASM domain